MLDKPSKTHKKIYGIFGFQTMLARWKIFSFTIFTCFPSSKRVVHSGKFLSNDIDHWWQPLGGAAYSDPLATTAPVLTRTAWAFRNYTAESMGPWWAMGPWEILRKFWGFLESQNPPQQPLSGPYCQRNIRGNFGNLLLISF